MQLLVKIGVLIWLGAGVSLFAMKEMGTLPLGALGLYVLIWIAVAAIPAAARVIARRNPFNRMTAAEQDRAVDLILSVNAPTEENTAELQALLEKYAPRHTEAERAQLLVAELGTALGQAHLAGSKVQKGSAVVLAPTGPHRLRT